MQVSKQIRRKKRGAARSVTPFVPGLDHAHFRAAFSPTAQPPGGCRRGAQTKGSRCRTRERRARMTLRGSNETRTHRGCQSSMDSHPTSSPRGRVSAHLLHPRHRPHTTKSRTYRESDRRWPRASRSRTYGSGWCGAFRLDTPRNHPRKARGDHQQARSRCQGHSIERPSPEALDRNNANIIGKASPSVRQVCCFRSGHREGPAQSCPNLPSDRTAAAYTRSQFETFFVTKWAARKRCEKSVKGAGNDAKQLKTASKQYMGPAQS